MPMLTVIDTITEDMGRGVITPKSPTTFEISLSALAPKLLLTLNRVPKANLKIYAGTSNIVERPRASLNICEDWHDPKLTLILLNTRGAPQFAFVLIASPREIDIAKTVLSLRAHFIQKAELTMEYPFLFLPYYLEGKPNLMIQELLRA